MGNPGDFDDAESFTEVMEDIDGEFVSFFPSGLVKLHFFDGVF